VRPRDNFGTVTADITRIDPDLIRARENDNRIASARRALRLAGEALRVAHSADVSARPFGVACVLVFGEAVRSNLLNLKRNEGRPQKLSYEAWYSPYAREMDNDPLLNHLHQCRTFVAHEGYDRLVSGEYFVFTPQKHRGNDLSDTKLDTVAPLYFAYLESMIDDAAKHFPTTLAFRLSSGHEAEVYGVWPKRVVVTPGIIPSFERVIRVGVDTHEPGLVLPGDMPANGVIDLLRSWLAQQGVS
jgi:hypothetical protein